VQLFQPQSILASVPIHWFACCSNVLKFNLVDELEAYVLIKKGIVRPLTAACQNCLTNICCLCFVSKEKCRSLVKQENGYEMQPAVLAYAFYFSLSSGAEAAGTSVADCGWAKLSAK